MKIRKSFRGLLGIKFYDHKQTSNCKCKNQNIYLAFNPNDVSNEHVQCALFDVRSWCFERWISVYGETCVASPCTMHSIWFSGVWLLSNTVHENQLFDQLNTSDFRRNLKIVTRSVAIVQLLLIWHHLCDRIAMLNQFNDCTVMQPFWNFEAKRWKLFNGIQIQRGSAMSSTHTWTHFLFGIRPWVCVLFFFFG